MFKNKVSDLAKVVLPPEAPADWSEPSLKRNSRILMIEFPQDAIDFGKTFGSGEFDAAYSWDVWSPARENYPSLVLQFSRSLNIFKEATGIDDVPFGIFPEVGGMLPFAATPDGDYVGWITKGAPEDWRVVDLSSYENGSYEILEMNLSEYFYNVLTRKLMLKRHEGGEAWAPSDVRFNPKTQKRKA